MLRISRRDFKALGMTQARMDILHALRRATWDKRIMWQSALRRILGYTARSTMTQMLQALEAIGWIRRRRSRQDARQLEVELTPDGHMARHDAHFHFIATAWSYDAPEVALGWAPPLPEESDAWVAYHERTGRLQKILRYIRVALRDTGCLRYEWFSD